VFTFTVELAFHLGCSILSCDEPAGILQTIRL